MSTSLSTKEKKTKMSPTPQPITSNSYPPSALPFSQTGGGDP